MEFLKRPTFKMDEGTMGRPKGVKAFKPGTPAKERLLATRVVTDSGCWEWTGDRERYGRLTVDKKRWTAHRLAYVTFVGPIPDGLLVCHRCDNPPCFNPEHLFLGTSAENTLDMVQKGRQIKDPPWLREYNEKTVGERHPNSKLTNAQAAAIKRDPRRNADIAKEYGISKSTVAHIKTGRVWAKALTSGLESETSVANRSLSTQQVEVQSSSSP